MITSKQRAKLRSLSNDYQTIFQIGKSGISNETVLQVGNALEARELIKLRVLDACEYTAGEAAAALSEALGADVISVIGSRFVLYRESQTKKKIDLSAL